MRLDHLLSREPIFVGNKRVLAGLVGAWLFSCACMCLLPNSGWWVWVRFWVGHKKFSADKHTVGFTFNTVLASAIVVVVACIAC